MGVPTFTGHVMAPQCRNAKGTRLTASAGFSDTLFPFTCLASHTNLSFRDLGPTAAGSKCHQHSSGGHSPPVAHTRWQVAALEEVNP